MRQFARSASILAPSILLSFFVFVSALVTSVSAQELRDVAYTYDELGRLETVRYKGLSADGGDIVYTYSYDPAGNRTTLQVEGNAFSSVLLEDVYALEGDTIQVPVIASAPLRGEVSFNWQVTSGSGQVVVADRSGTFSLTAAQAIGLQGQIGTIDITTIEDSTKESNEEIVITISDAENLWIDPLDDTSSIFLQDDDVTYFTLENQAAIEGNMLSFTVTKVSPPSAPSETITVTFGTENLEAILATDFEQPDPVTLDFLPADTSLDVTIDALSDAIVELDERFLLEASWTSESLYSGLYGAYGTIEDGPTEPIGEELFTTPGTHQWTVPTGITSVNAVCVGGGGSGGVYTNLGRVGGGGGGLGWRNNIAVTPGEQITVVVGSGGSNKSSGQDSSFNGSSVVGNGGTAYSSAPADNAIGYKSGGGFVGEGGGAGGDASMATYTGNDAGGGGAGGYAGAGGRGRITSSGGNDDGTSGTGGGGAGGGINGDGLPGGGVGLYGTGAGPAGTYSATTGGQGGSGGGSAQGSVGGLYGGGGGSPNNVSQGGAGACRVMWGPGLSFPGSAQLSDATPGGGSGTSPSTFSVSSGTGDEGSTATLTVSRSAPADRAYTVNLSTSGTATAPADYTMSPSSLNFAVGQLSQTVTFTLETDNTYDPNEFITLEAAWSDAENGAQTATGTLTIGDIVLPNTRPAANNDTFPDFTLTPLGILADENTQACEGSSVFDVLANDTDADGDTLSIKPNSLSIDAGNLQPKAEPSIGTVNGRDGIFLEFAGTGNYVVNYVAQDDKGGESEVAQLTVTAGYQPGTGELACVQGTVSGGGNGTTNPVPDIWIEGPAQGALEGDPLTYTIKMSNSYHRSISIVWKDVGGSAIRTTDYVYPSQLDRTVRISNGQQTTFTVDTVVDADVVDGNKDLILGIESVTVGNIVAPLSASGTILDDDVAGNSSPVLQPDYFTVQMSDPLGNGNYFGQGTFDVLANDSDPDAGDSLTLLNTVQLMPGYAGLGSVSVANGQISATFQQCGRYRFEYEVVDDQNAKSVSFLDVRTDPNGTLPNCPVATAPLPEPAPVVVIGDASTVTEGENLLFPVTLSKTYPDPVRVGWTVTANASDVDAASGILNFNPGDALTKNIVLSTVDDSATEGTETVTVALDATQQVNAVLGATTSGDGTITDNDTSPTFSIAGPPADVPEGGDLIYTITKTGSSSQSFTVNYTITLGSTTSTNDIGSVAMSGSKTFASGTTTQTVVVPTVDDSDWEQAESVFVNITSVSNGGTIGTATAEGKIGNNDGEPIINIFNTSVFEATANTTATVTIFLQGGTSQPVTVNYRTTAGTATSGTDYTEVSSGSVTIQPGDFDATFDVTIIGDSLIESDETVNLEVVSAVNARTVTTNINASNPNKGSNGVLTIKNDDYYQYSDGGVSWSGVCSGSGSTGTEYGSYTRYCTIQPAGVSCGTTNHTASRTCSIPQTQIYTNGPVSWSGTCSASGVESGTYTRTCTESPSGNHCGSSTQSTTRACTATYSNGPVTWSGTCSGGTESGTYTQYCTWSPGSTSCGTSTQSTSRTCTITYTYAWSATSWSPWQCSGTGTIEERTGTRSCIRSPGGASVAGSNCGGSTVLYQTRDNNSPACGGSGGF